MLDTRKSNKPTKLITTNNFEYIAYMYELLEDDLTIYAGTTKELTIKFNQEYNIKYNNAKILFNNFCLNYNSNKKETKVFEVDV